jgi:hypothetical protein
MAMKSHSRKDRRAHSRTTQATGRIGAERGLTVERLEARVPLAADAMDGLLGVAGSTPVEPPPPSPVESFSWSTSPEDSFHWPCKWLDPKVESKHLDFLGASDSDSLQMKESYGSGQDVAAAKVDYFLSLGSPDAVKGIAVHDVGLGTGDIQFSRAKGAGELSIKGEVYSSVAIDGIKTDTNFSSLSYGTDTEYKFYTPAN